MLYNHYSVRPGDRCLSGSTASRGRRPGEQVHLKGQHLCKLGDHANSWRPKACFVSNSAFLDPSCS